MTIHDFITSTLNVSQDSIEPFTSDSKKSQYSIHYLTHKRDVNMTIWSHYTSLFYILYTDNPSMHIYPANHHSLGI